ncbi:MAG: Ig-like domain-containing protein [Longimicrobiales bacterium]|nr:Ig-like domain-containing protein [Longimicrobiales bacterium]
MNNRIVQLGMLAVVWIGCARPGAPVGGPIDNVGPQVVSTIPDTFAVMSNFDGPIELVFDERISESTSSGTLQESVKISPRLGEVTVNHSSRGLKIQMEGGFPGNMIYRVTVLPTVRDLFQNPMPYPFEFLFSTGPEMLPNVAAGVVIDGITLLPLEGTTIIASVKAFGAVDTESESGLEHVAITDSSGVYAFRYLPAGNYSITAFVDENRNNSPELTEPVAEDHLVVNPNDTVFLDMRLLRPDSTSAELNAIRLIDSLTLLVEFDDYLNPEQILAGNVRATLSSDSTNLVETTEILSKYEYDNREDMLRDTLSNTGSPENVDNADIFGPERTSDKKIPSQVIYLILSEPIRVGFNYEVSIFGLENINGIGSGGGTSSIMREPPDIPRDTLVVSKGLVYER